MFYQRLTQAVSAVLARDKHIQSLRYITARTLTDLGKTATIGRKFYFLRFVANWQSMRSKVYCFSFIFFSFKRIWCYSKTFLYQNKDSRFLMSESCFMYPQMSISLSRYFSFIYSTEVDTLKTPRTLSFHG